MSTTLIADTFSLVQAEVTVQSVALHPEDYRELEAEGAVTDGTLYGVVAHQSLNVARYTITFYGSGLLFHGRTIAFRDADPCQFCGTPARKQLFNHKPACPTCERAFTLGRTCR